MSVQDAAERGAGGKFKKPLSRKPPATPYARPQQRSRWLSKLVDPAYRLISGGATRVLPSLFSKSPECSILPPVDQQQEEDHDKLDQEVEENVADDGALNYGETRLNVSGPGSSTGGSKSDSGFDGCKDDKTGDGVSEIERLVKEKTFSRDEINRLIEILNSRTVELPHVEQENEFLGMTVRNAERPMLALGSRRKSIDEKEEDLIRAPRGTSTAVMHSSMQEEVGASPIDIARAYMGTRTSELGLCSKSVLSKDERISSNGDEFAIRPFIPSSSPKPSTCWPGAMLQDQRGYLTPRSERARFGLHNFPRTPYSRTIFSKSKSKLTQLQADGSGNLTISSTPLQQSQTPIFEQSRRNKLDDVRGSVGPIRRIQHKVVAESPFRGSVNFHSSLIGRSPLGNSDVSEGFFPAVKKNLETRGTSGSSEFLSIDSKITNSEVGVQTVHPHSSQMARTILEHLERSLPTPKDKSAELKIATSWKKTHSSNVSSAMPTENHSLLHLGGLDSYKNTDQSGTKNSARSNEARANSFFKVPQENTDKSKDAVEETTSASDIKVDNIFTIQGGKAGPSQDPRKTLDFQIKSRNENDSMPASSASESDPLNLQRKPSSHPVGNKPVLSSIFVGKADQRWTFSPDNSTGFTFPVSASSTGAFSEPPTPSIMPSFPASGMHQPKEGSGVPSFSFGSNRPSSPLVFAFPSTSNPVARGDASDLKFSFGSEEPRISFSSIGKDAICY